MNAVILAAGRSTRLRPLTDDLPKSLLPIAGVPILRRMLTILSHTGVRRVVIVTGYLEEKVRAAVDEWKPALDVRFVRNERWATTNNCYSLLLGAEAFGGDPFMSIDGDVVFERSVIETLLRATPGNRFALRRAPDLDDEEMKVELDAASQLVRIGKTIPPEEAAGEAVGIWVFETGAAAILGSLRDRIVTRGLYDEWYEASFQQAIDRGLKVAAIEVRGYVAEVDTPDDLARVARAFEGFWSAYKASNRPPEVDEITDWFQRPLGYLIARAALPTPITPNGITVLSMLFAVAAAACWLWPFAHHLPIGGALLFTAAILDAADGQLARMRATQSSDGRMLDGVADGVTAVAVVASATWLLWTKYNSDPRLAALFVVLSLLTAYTGSMHTSMYDHYKNVWLKITQQRIQEGEDYETALRRYRTGTWSPVMNLVWTVYLGYVRSQEALIRRFDPYTTASVNVLPRYDKTRGEIYRRHTRRTQSWWKLFGFGTVIIGIAIFAAMNALEYYVALRLLVLHPIFWLWVRPLQQRASRDAFAEMRIDGEASASVA
jgi:choline kinase/phosphatidylglycerophosphate synthase